MHFSQKSHKSFFQTVYATSIIFMI